MDFFKTIKNNYKMIFQLGRNDFRNKFAGTGLGAIWGFISPFIFMAMYVIVFQFILKTGSAGNYPFVVWYIPGMAMWQFLNDAIINATNSIRNYSYLVKKVVFPIDIIPLISLISSFTVGIFLFVVAFVVCILFGYVANVLLMIYMIFAAICFIVAITRLTSALATLVPDVSQFLAVFMQLFFWATPIIWNLNMLATHPKLLTTVKSIPFSYLVTGFRSAFIGEGNIVTENHFMYTAIFWVVTLIIFVWGNYVFKKSKKDFADVL